MTPEQRALETLVLQQNAVDYWHWVDHRGGAGVSAMFTQDGVFHAGPGKPLVGRAAIEEFYGWRQDRGARVVRQVVHHCVRRPDDFRRREHGDQPLQVHDERV